MQPNLESRIRAALQRLSSVPSDPEGAREFMQRRVSLFLLVSWALWGGVFVVDRVLGAMMHGNWAKADELPTWHRQFIGLHVLGVLVLVGAWAATRRGKPAVVRLMLTDAFAALFQVTIYCAMIEAADAAMRPELYIVLVVAHILVLRAAIVPSPPIRSALLALVIAIPVSITTYAIYARRPGEFPWAPTPWHALVGTTIWMGVTLVATTVMSSVVHGLQRRVQAALELGQYTLLEKLGEGGMGAVYRARHALLRRPTAVKVLRAENAAETMIARFEREVQLTSEITHPNIVSIYDYGRSPDGSFYYAMEYLCGSDLQRLVEEHGPQPPGRVVHILEQTASALAEAHSVGLIHRDVKPANIILCDNPRHPDRIKVFDFGLVKEMESETAVTGTTALTGTPLYMAPEVITAPDRVDPRTDLYALGAVGYFLLTGTLVFDGKSIVEVCAHHLHQPVEPPSQRLGRPVPAKLEAVILACLEKTPDKRPPHANALADALRACDDVTRWTSDDARGWWAERPAAQARAGEGLGLATTQTLTMAARSDQPRPRASA